MKPYADTSFATSLYLTQRASSAAELALRTVRDAFPLTWLLRLEFRNAFYLAVHQGDVAEEQRAQLWSEFMEDCASGKFQIEAVEESRLIREAEFLCDSYTAAVGIRTLDLLHVASARMLGCQAFYSFDIRQREFARIVGMRVLPRQMPQ